MFLSNQIPAGGILNGVAACIRGAHSRANPLVFYVAAGGASKRTFAVGSVVVVHFKAKSIVISIGPA